DEHLDESVGAQGAVLQIVFELVDVVHTLWISNGAEFGKRDFHRLDSYLSSPQPSGWVAGSPKPKFSVQSRNVHSILHRQA
ncbi:MAG: hypothetical protein ACFCD0_21715, partial [Gemmataceae bacterium]